MTSCPIKIRKFVQKRTKTQINTIKNIRKYHDAKMHGAKHYPYTINKLTNRSLLDFNHIPGLPAVAGEKKNVLFTLFLQHREKKR